MKIRIDPLDTLFSKFIRLRAIKNGHGCERCGAYKENYKELQCSHLLGRWKKSIRWDEENAIGACGGCHMTLDRDHLEKENFIIGHLRQDRYDLLKGRARITYPPPDKKAIELYFKEKIKELE